MKESELVATLLLHYRANGIPEPTPEHRFHGKRRWRFDLAWPEQMAAVEVEGGVYTNGRHTRGSGFTADCEKYNEAALDGWRVIRVTAAQIDDGSAVAWTWRLLGLRQGEEAPPF